MPEHFKVVRIPRKALYQCLALLATQPGHPSVHMRNEYWPWSRPLPGKKRQVLRNNSPPPVPQDCWHTELTALDIICASLAANVRHISIILRLTVSDSHAQSSLRLRRWKSICVPNFNEIFHSTAEIKLLPACHFTSVCQIS